MSREKLGGRRMGSIDAVLAALQKQAVPAETIRDLITQLLDAAQLDFDQRVEILGGALVSESVRPFWEGGDRAAEAHGRLRDHDGELADVIESLSPMLLGRAEAREDAARAIAEAETMFVVGQRPLL